MLHRVAVFIIYRLSVIVVEWLNISVRESAICCRGWVLYLPGRWQWRSL